MLLPAPAPRTTVSAPQVPLIARVLPSLTDLAFLLPVIFLFGKLAGARTLLGDGDTGWHIRTGEWILANGRVPSADMFSFSRPGQPWFAWEWLWDVAFALLHQWQGMAAVVFVSLLVICLTSALLFRLVRRKCGSGLFAVAVTLLATGACAIHWLARPHLFTMLFLTVTLHITERAREGRTKLLWWLAPLTVLWTNLHGGFFVVLLTLGCYIAADLSEAAVEWKLTAEKRVRLQRWTAVFAVCFALTFVNPYGWQLHKHVVEYITDPYQLQHITEFQSMNFHAPVVVYFEPLMILAILAAAWNARRRRFTEVFMSMGWMHLALVAQRNLPLFAIVSAPMVAEAIVEAVRAARSAAAPWMRKASRWAEAASGSFDETDRIGRLFLASAAPLAIVGVLLFLPKPVAANFDATYDPKTYPEKALTRLRGPATQRIFAEDEWGDYLIYRLYPAKKVFIDGRSDFYGAKFGEQYLDLIEVKYGWQKMLDRYRIDTIVLAPKFALASTLKISADWRLEYDDGVALIFRRIQRPQSSLVSGHEGEAHDPAIARVSTSDRMVTQTTTQRRNDP